MLTLGCYDTPRGAAEDFLKGNRREINGGIIRDALEQTNLNGAETWMVTQVLMKADIQTRCRKHPEQKLLLESDETGQVCTIRLHTREPVLMSIRAEYEVLMAMPGPRERRGVGNFPVIEHATRELEVLGFRQGILWGERRAPGVWRMVETQ